MVSFFERHTALKFVAGNWIPDVHGKVPGAGTQGHQLIATPYDGRQLGRRDDPGPARHHPRKWRLSERHRPSARDVPSYADRQGALVARPRIDLGRWVASRRKPSAAMSIEASPSPVAWAPVSLVPHRDGSIGHFPHIIDRAKPGIIGVLADGRRFVNEADGYYDYVAAMLRAVPPGQEVASWLICSHAAQRRYSLGFAKPAPVPLAPYLHSGYLKSGRTIEELARVCGIDPAGLKRTIEEYNRDARNGEDPAFGRGSTPYNRNGGDPDHKPNPCVAPIERGPFYAVKILPGSFGTFAGLVTDAHTRVLNKDGNPIPGLHAAGTDMSSVMGGYYPAGGINIGPAMTFGYIAGRQIAGATDYEDRIARGRI
jgi:succinate dehydrogenase/fumarate reductase flavoprotein subunit